MIAWILFFIFLVLRACDAIDWAWYWVMSPLAFGFALSIFIHLAKHPL